MSNRAAVMPEVGSLETRDLPTPQPLQALVCIEAVPVCGSDVACDGAGRIGNWKVDGPPIRGHEAAGMAVGADTTLKEIGTGDLRGELIARGAVLPRAPRSVVPVTGRGFSPVAVE